MYKNAAGEVTAPNLDEDMVKRTEDSSFTFTLMFGFIVFMWICQQLFFGMTGTFFVGKVLQSYEMHFSNFPMYHYKTKAKYNEECFQIMNIFQSQKAYKVIFFSMDKELKREEDTQWLGVSHAGKSFSVDMAN